MGVITISDEMFERLKKTASPEKLEILNKFKLGNIKQKSIDEYNKARVIEQQRILRRKKEEEKKQQKKLAKELKRKRKLEKMQNANAEHRINWAKQRNERLKQTKELLARREQARADKKRRIAKATRTKHLISDPAPGFPKIQSAKKVKTIRVKSNNKKQSIHRWASVIPISRIDRFALK